MRGTAAIAVMALVAGGAIGTAPPADAEPVLQRLAGPDRIATAVAVSEAAFDDATTVVLARADVPADALAGTPLAAQLGAPLLLTRRDELPAVVHAEIDRLGAAEVVLLGGTQALGPEVERALADLDVRRIFGADRIGTALAIARELPPTSRAFVARADGYADALAAGPVAARAGDAVLLLGPDTAAVRAHLDDREVAEVVVVGGEAAISPMQADALAGPGRTVIRLSGTDRYGSAAAVARLGADEGADARTVWITSGTALADSLAAGPAVAAAGATLLVLNGLAPWTTRPATDLLRAWQPEHVVVVGGAAAVADDLQWQLPVIVDGPELPLGGAGFFPHHRLVAFYGHHRTGALGVLGEQPPDEAYDRLVRAAAPFGADGREVLPTFELIVSLATAGAGPDGDYSAPSSPEDIQPWLDAARRNGAYLLLDLQPGRTDFLTEARRYEQFLRQPDVGLALDPEWRMDPDEVPGQTVGSVDAAEVNAVSAWLAQLVREAGLPQKLLVVHQFQLRMLTNRHQLILRPELATLIQMDGQGSRAAKLDTYRALTRDAGPWHHGFKLFYDEDPDLFQPHDVLGLHPRPEYVSYQ